MPEPEHDWREEAEWWLVQRGIDFESRESLAQLLQRAEQRGLERAAEAVKGVTRRDPDVGLYGAFCGMVSTDSGDYIDIDEATEALDALIAEGRGEEKTQGEGVGS